MKAWLVQHRIAIIGVVCTLAVLLLTFSSESFQSCVYSNRNIDAEKSFYEGVSHFLIALGILRGCTGYFIHESGDAITAMATLIIAIFTWTLWRTSAEQGRLNQAALKLASDEFTASHRPKLFVQTVSMNIWGAPPHETVIEFIVVNGGESKAYPIKALAFGYIQGVNSTFDPKEAAATPIFPEGKDLEPGERTTLKVQSGSIKTAYDDEFLAGGRMFVLGRVEYAGKDGIVRVTGFCREYSRDTGAYAPVPHSEHDYTY